jgi:hypothetical protein
LIVFGDFDASNAKHTPFAERADEIAGKTLALNIRRLPFWVLSRAQHVARWGIHPDYVPIPMASPQELSESNFPDTRLAIYTDDGRFRIDSWIRIEHLVNDFLEFVSPLTDVTEERSEAVRSVPMVNAHAYDHDLSSWFSQEQIERLYQRNPGWAALERQLYGGLFETPVGVEGAG